jgi:hypothetical protein
MALAMRRSFGSRGGGSGEAVTAAEVSLFIPGKMVSAGGESKLRIRKEPAPLTVLCNQKL